MMRRHKSVARTGKAGTRAPNCSISVRGFRAEVTYIIHTFAGITEYFGINLQQLSRLHFGQFILLNSFAILYLSSLNLCSVLFFTVDA